MASPVSSAHINKKIILAAAAVAFSFLGACAKKAPVPGAVVAPPAEQASQRIDPTTPAGVAALPKELMAHPRSIYSAASGKYSYYIGGRLLAQYDSDTQVLVLTGEGAAEGEVCKYSPGGTLFTGPQEPPAKQANAAQCNALVLELYQHMHR